MMNGNEKIEGAQGEGEGLPNNALSDQARAEGQSPAQIGEAMMADALIDGALKKGAIKNDPRKGAPAKAKGKAKMEGAKAAKLAKASAMKADAPAARAKAAKGRDARQAAFDAAKAQAEAAKAARPLSAGSDIGRDAEMKFSGLAHNFPSIADIEKGEGLCKRMIARDLDQYRAAIKGQLPHGAFDGSPIDLNLQTHAGYKGKWKALKAMIEKGDLAALRAWNGGLGIRQNSSSSKPLGRFHQCAILALEAKEAAKRKRAAGKAKGDGAAEGAQA